jgi:hypothetical protein
LDQVLELSGEATKKAAVTLVRNTHSSLAVNKKSSLSFLASWIGMQVSITRQSAAVHDFAGRHQRLVAGISARRIDA